MLQQTQVATVVGVLRPLPAGVSHDRCPRRGRRRGGPAIVGRAGLLSPGAATPSGGQDHRGRARRPLSPRSAGRPPPAGHRPLHGRGHPLDRLRRPTSRSWRPTPCGSGAGCWVSAATRARPKGNGCSGRRPRPCCRGAAPAGSNQALMELGSEVCTLRAPRCEACPAASLCRANREGRQGEIPRPKAKRRIEAVREAAVLVRRRGRVLLVRWPEGRRWAGLWDFPRFPLSRRKPGGDPPRVGRERPCDDRRADCARAAASTCCGTP